MYKMFTTFYFLFTNNNRAVLEYLKSHTMFLEKKMHIFEEKNFLSNVNLNFALLWDTDFQKVNNFKTKYSCVSFTLISS